MSDASAVSASNASQHSWDKVKVGFTSIMPNQTIEFPVQISDPNAVVYMTIFAFSGRKPVCDNVQIDANYIKIDKVNIEGFGKQVQWQPGVKPPKSKTGAATADLESIAAKTGVFTIYGFCDYLEKQSIDGKKIQFIKEMLGNADYQLPAVDADGTRDETPHLYAHIKDVLKIYNKKNGVVEEKVAIQREQKQINTENGLIYDSIGKYLNTTLQKTILKFDVVAIDTAARHDDQKQIQMESMTRIDSLLDIDKMCLFLQNKGIAPNKKILFIQESLGGYGATYVLTQDSKKTLIDEISGIVHIYDTLHELKKEEHHDITLENCERLIDRYKEIVNDMKQFFERHEKHSVKYELFQSHRDDDSDDEELHAVEKFFDCDSHALLESWGLSQFHERMADEGWKNPLDWVHLDDHILKQNIGFRPGHIQIFN
eukprot:119638_1